MKKEDPDRIKPEDVPGLGRNKPSHKPLERTITYKGKKNRANCNKDLPNSQKHISQHHVILT
jgi:hypothetical protein